MIQEERKLAKQNVPSMMKSMITQKISRAGAKQQ